MIARAKEKMIFLPQPVDMYIYIRMYVLIRRTASNLTASSLFILLPSTRRDGLINPGDFPPCGINPGRDRPTICSRFSSVFFLPSSLPSLSLPAKLFLHLLVENSIPLFPNTDCGHLDLEQGTSNSGSPLNDPIPLRGEGEGDPDRADYFISSEPSFERGR